MFHFPLVLGHFGEVVGYVCSRIPRPPLKTSLHSLVHPAPRFSAACGVVSDPSSGHLRVLLAGGRLPEPGENFASTFFHLEDAFDPEARWRTGEELPARIRKPPAANSVFSFWPGQAAVYAYVLEDGNGGEVDLSSVLELDVATMKFSKQSISVPHKIRRVRKPKSHLIKTAELRYTVLVKFGKNSSIV